MGAKERGSSLAPCKQSPPTDGAWRDARMKQEELIHELLTQDTNLLCRADFDRTTLRRIYKEVKFPCGRA